jgi:hypothetical protein
MRVDNKIVQSASIAAVTCKSSGKRSELDGQNNNLGSALTETEPTVSFDITIPESMRDELDLAIREIFQGRRTRMDSLERDREGITIAAMKGLQTIVTTLETHKGTGQTTRLALFLAGVYNGSDYPFDLTWLRMLDTKLANACLDYLNFDRLGVNEVHAYLPGGAEQLHRWLAESGRGPKSRRRQKTR